MTMTFENFIVGKANADAVQLAKQVAQRPGEVSPLLFIYGGRGLGKTHLLSAIATEISVNHPGIKITQIQGSDLAFELVQGQKETLWKLADVILVDNAQLLSSLDELAEFFAYCRENNKQVVLASNRRIEEMGLRSEAKKFLDEGVVTQLSEPEYELRLAFLRKLCLEKNVTLEDEVLSYTAKNVPHFTMLKEAFGRFVALLYLMGG